jgi:protein-tyrosine phosphatase
VKSILFVCLGNICRSPLAEGIAKNILLNSYHDNKIKIESAGTSEWHIGEAPCEDSIKIAAYHDINISAQKAQQINTEMLKNFDTVVALDDSNYTDLKKLNCKNLYKLGDFYDSGADVPDPYFFKGSDRMEGFEKVFIMIERNVRALLKDNIKS